MKGVFRFGKRGKLSPRYVGPYEILERMGKAAYKLALPAELWGVHPVFHVSMLRKYILDPSHVIAPQEIQLNPTLDYEEAPVRIIDCQVRRLRTKEVPLVKIVWAKHGEEEVTWESEEDMQ